MKHLSPYVFIISIFVLASCSTESCKIDFEKNSKNYQNAITDIINLQLRMTSNEPYSRIVKTIKKADGLLKDVIFSNVEFVECHEDSTVIFQAPNCTKGSALKDDIFVLIYAPKGEAHIHKKRNVRGLKRINEHWFQGYHVLTLTN